jgi:hypothetical protein
MTYSNVMPGKQPVSALRTAWPAMLLSAVILLPFLNGPFTIDDPLYLREAQHTLTDPLHPQAFDVVWLADLRLHASQILPGGVAVPYLLLPVVVTVPREWVGHLIQLIFLLIGLHAAAGIAVRLGLDEWQSRWALLLTATAPAVLGMAGTVMPDVPAMMFVALGMERILAWRDERRWPQALFATCWLALAMLTRMHTALVLGAAFILLLDGITRDEIRHSLTNFPARFWPLIFAPLVYFGVSQLTNDPNPSGDNLLNFLFDVPGAKRITAQNVLAYLAHYVFIVPLTIPWMLVKGRRFPYILAAVGLLGAGLVSIKLGWVSYVAAVTAVVMLDILIDALRRHDRVQLGLWCWLLLPAPIIVYVHLPAKYLLPCAMAATMLVMRRMPDASAGVRRWLAPSLAVVGAAAGLLVLLGSRDLAEVQKRAVVDLVEPHVRSYERVWYAGHWGFHWYAEEAGAKAAALNDLPPHPGDILVISRIDNTFLPAQWLDSEHAYKITVLTKKVYPCRYGCVMDNFAGAGFFSSGYGYLPWLPGPGSANRFEVWRVDSTGR